MRNEKLERRKEGGRMRNEKGEMRKEE